MKVKVISLPYIFQVLYVLCFTRPRYQVSVYRTIGPLVLVDGYEWLVILYDGHDNSIGIKHFVILVHIQIVNLCDID